MMTNTKTALIVTGIAIAIVVAIAGIRIGLLLRSIGTYRSYWKKEAARNPESGELTYIALGDSAAQAVGATSVRRGYVGLTAEYIAKKTGKNVHIINISVTGAKIADAIKIQIPQLATLPKPDYITIEIGANDMASYDASAFKQEFETLLKKLPPGTIVANMPSFNGGRKGKVNPSAYSATQTINRLVASHSEFILADLYKSTINQGFLDFGADLFHPSNRGYHNWANAFMNEIDKTL